MNNLLYQAKRNVLSAHLNLVEKSTYKASFDDNFPPKIKHLEFLRSINKINEIDMICLQMLKQMNSNKWRICIKT